MEPEDLHRVRDFDDAILDACQRPRETTPAGLSDTGWACATLALLAVVGFGMGLIFCAAWWLL